MDGIDFFIAGFAKCGSTTLYTILSGHPELYLAPEKDWKNLIDDIYDHDALIGLYRYAPAGLKRGFCSVRISSFEHVSIAVKRLKHYFPGSRIIFIVRDPVARIESSYRDHHDHLPRVGKSMGFDLEDAFVMYPDLIEQGRYWTHYSQFRKYFDDNCLLIVFLEDLLTRPNEVINRICAFLGVSPMVVPAVPKLNSGATKYYDTERLWTMRKPRLDPATSRMLRMLQPEIQNQFLPQLGLRIPFDGTPIDWPHSCKRLVFDRLAHDTETLLSFFDRSRSLWPNYARLRREMKTRVRKRL